MTTPFPLVLGLALAVLGAASVSAQQRSTPPSPDRGALATCLREETRDPRACIGSIAVPCLRQASRDGAGADLACARRERAAWRERLDEASRILASRLDATGRARFAALQRQWEGYAAQNCAFKGDLAPPAVAAATLAACDLREVALRALDLEATTRRSARPARNNPPRIER